MKKLLGKRLLFLVSLLVCLCMPAMAQKNYNFNAVAIDVDGLPQSISVLGNANQVINPNGLDGVGAEQISKYISMQDWGVIGVTQDFNYHNELVSSFATEVTGSVSFTPTATTGNSTGADDYAKIEYKTADGTYNASGKKIVLGSGKSLTISTTPKSGETENLVITSVQISYPARTGNWLSGYTYYYGNSLNPSNGTVGKRTSDSGAGTITISDVNNATLTLTNGTNGSELHITKIVVNYRRTYGHIYKATSNYPDGAVGKEGNVLNSAFDGRINNDGICMIYAPEYNITQSEQVYWNDYSTENASDKLLRYDDDYYVKRGYRQFAAEIADGILVDVYVLNLDQGVEDGDATARSAQLTDLATAILDNTNNRPMIVMGTFNTLYTQAKLKEEFIDAINNGKKGLTINDAWVELMRGGEYPVYGTEDELVNTGYYDGQRGETYNKIFYVNNVNSKLSISPNAYKRKEDMIQVDHMPILVNFTVTDPNSESSSNSDWTVDVDDAQIPNVPTAGAQAAAGTYFIKNVSTGLYLKAGGQWATQLCEGSAGMEFTLIKANADYQLQTYAGYVGDNRTPYVDQSAGSWTLKPVEGTTYQYYLTIEDGTQALSSTGEPYDVVTCKPYNASDSRQKWILLTEAKMKEQMKGATPTNPYDITPLVKSAGFDRLDIDKIASSSWPGLSFYNIWGQYDQNGIAYYEGTEAKTISHALSSMPAGKYVVTFEGYYRARAYSSFVNVPILNLAGNRQDFPWNVQVSLGDASTIVPLNANATMNDIIGAAVAFRDNDQYLTSFTYNHEGQGNMTLKITIPAFTGGDEDRVTLLALDNFVVKYLGTENDEDGNNRIKELVGNYINETAQKVAQLNQAGKDAYDITEVIYRYENDLLSEDGSVEIAMIDAAYELALQAHNAYNASQATNGYDYTSLIVNPSFELGNVGWNNLPTWGITVESCKEGGTAMNEDYQFGDKLLNAWRGDAFQGLPATTQTVTGLKNGLYKLQAKVTSFPGKMVYLIGNDSHAGVVAVDKTTFQQGELYFLVEDGSATIGVVGGYNGYYYATGCFYKADDFHLTYVCDLAHGRVALAHDVASAAYTTLDQSGKQYADANVDGRLSKLLTKYDGAIKGQIQSLANSNGLSEAAEIYAQLTAAALRQKSVGADMTWCFGDPSFETGKYKQYWQMEGDTWGDFKVVKQNDVEYSAVGTEGNYLFNAYDWTGADALKITIGSDALKIPNGTYELSAMVTTHNNCKVYIEGNGTPSEPVVARDINEGLLAAQQMYPITLRFDVTNGKAEIRTYAKDADDKAYLFFKADDFHLRIISLEENTVNTTLYFDEDVSYVPIMPRSSQNYTKVVVRRTIKGDNWNTFVVPFDLDYKNHAVFKDWEVKKFAGTYNDSEGDVVITFTDADEIKAGVTYMIRKKNLENPITSFEVGNGTTVIDVNTTFVDDNDDSTHPENDDVKITGVYHNNFVPKGAYFISNNNLYQAKSDKKNRLKGFRGYIEVKSSQAGARKLSFRISEGTDVDTPNNNEVTVVAIYNLNGMRLNDMEPGVNILQMSDGTSMKVIIE